MITNALTSVLIALNIAPQGAQQIVARGDSGTPVGYVDLGYLKPDYSAPKLYSFGLLADAHVSGLVPEPSTNHLGNALRHLTEKEQVEFTVLAGDVGSDYTSRLLDLYTYSNVVASVSGCMPVYPTPGCKDAPASQNDVTDIETFKAITGTTSFYTSGAVNSYEITVTHTPEGGSAVTDHFLFLGMKNALSSSSLANAYLNADIEWLGVKLNDYKNDRCFVITHLFFPDAAGNVNDAYVTTKCLGGTQLAALQAFRTQYPRVVWFSGHSHYKWQYQERDLTANVYPTTNAGRTGAWTVHVPSCGQPAETSGAAGNLSLRTLESQGAVVDVYADYIDIRGIQFKGRSDSRYANRYLPIAQYRLPTAPAPAN